MINTLNSTLSQAQQNHLMDYLYIQIQALDAASIVAITDEKGVIKYVNKKFCEISGYPEEELLGKTHSIINSGLHSKSFFADLWKTILAGNVWKGEIRNKSKAGDFYWVETTIIPFKDPNTQQFQFVSIRNEITDKKNSEEIIKENQARLQYSDKMASLGILSAGISHELGNPLSALSGRLEMLKRNITSNSLDTESMSAGVESCLQAVDRMTRIIRALRAYARDGAKDAFVKISLKSLLNDILELTTEKSRKENIKVDLLAKDEHFCDCRESEMGQVLVNLINNSIDAIKELPEKWIQIEVSEQEGFQIIIFRDSGHGIPDIIAKRIFDPFFTTKPVGKGTGLGLSISCQILEAHKGSLVYNANAKNTEFIIKIPKSQQQESTT